MHPMRLTNKQIQELVSDIRKQLKGVKVIDGVFDFSYKVPEQKDAEKAKLIFTQTAWNKMTALVDECDKGDVLEIDSENGIIRNVTKGKEYSYPPFNKQIRNIY